uniref:Transcriptional regulator n=1 Tax=Ascaris lumbricoides TaxID=6252 RepID=A0A0M3I0D5_ASCLU
MPHFRNPNMLPQILRSPGNPGTTIQKFALTHRVVRVLPIGLTNSAHAADLLAAAKSGEQVRLRFLASSLLSLLTE